MLAEQPSTWCWPKRCPNGLPAAAIGPDQQWQQVSFGTAVYRHSYTPSQLMPCSPVHEVTDISLTGYPVPKVERTFGVYISSSPDIRRRVRDLEQNLRAEIAESDEYALRYGEERAHPNAVNVALAAARAMMSHWSFLQESRGYDDIECGAAGDGDGGVELIMRYPASGPNKSIDVYVRPNSEARLVLASLQCPPKGPHPLSRPEDCVRYAWWFTQ